MSSRYTAKVSESLKLRGWIDEIQAKSLRADNARKDAEIVRLKSEAEKAKQERNSEGVRQRNIYLPQLQLHKQQLATYKAVAVEGGALLKECSDRLVTCQHTAYSYETKCCIDKCRQHLHTLSALTGDATPNPLKSPSL